MAEVAVVQVDLGVARQFAGPKQLREMLLANLQHSFWLDRFAHWDQHPEAGDPIPLVAQGPFGHLVLVVLEVALLEVVGDVLVNAL